MLRFQLCPCFQLFSACYTALRMKNSIRSAPAINPVTTEITDDSRSQMEKSHALRYCESTPWTVSKKKWDTKEDNGKSVMRAVVCQKAHLRTKLHRTVKKIKPIALAIIK